MACETEPMSRTYQYRKVMKPMLERKRRARINKCLDELKDLMVGALQSEGESITKLEKADVLELTVNHLKKLQKKGQLTMRPLPNYEDKFREGFSRCASEVSRCLASIPGVDITLGTQLMTRLGVTLTHLERRTPLTILVPSPEVSPAPSSGSSGYSSSYSSVSPTPSTSSRSNSPINTAIVSPKQHQGLLAIAKPPSPVWRPW
ncbi:UNVERIFIED_CONTAM: hypothetical protein RMT77_002515 [Armadillidium vulgare]|nr:Enhancer of split mbeta protein [Armadillidium vulgare]